MDKIITEAALHEAIRLLEMKQAKEGKRLGEEFHATYESLKPVNIVKSIFRETVSSPGIRKIVINKTVDVALVYLTNMILRKTTNSILKRTAGTVMVWGIKNIVSRNSEIVKKAGIGLLKIVGNIITKRNRNRES